MEKDLMTQEAADKFKEMVEEVNVCMFISDPDQDQTCRPMGTVKVDQDLNLWYLTEKHSLKIRDIERNNEVHLVYAHPGKNRYLDVWGNASLSTDRATIKDLWSPLFKAWFPEGENDRNICVVKVIPKRAHYWDANGNKIVSFFKMVTAAVTGKSVPVGESGELEI